MSLGEILGGTTFPPIRNALDAGGVCRGFVVQGAAGETSRKVLDGWTEFVRNYGLGGLLWGKVNDDGISGPLGKAVDDVDAFLSSTGASAGDLVLVGAGSASKVNTGMGRLRVHVAHERGLIEAGVHRFVWVVDFPLFERTEDGAITSVHHPFTSPTPDHVDRLGTDEVDTMLSDAYDLVCNGLEMGGGSIRIHDPAVQALSLIHISEPTRPY